MIHASGLVNTVAILAEVFSCFLQIMLAKFIWSGIRAPKSQVVFSLQSVLVTMNFDFGDPGIGLHAVGPEQIARSRQEMYTSNI